MGESVTIQTRDGPMPAYLARPARSPAPAVVVIQELFRHEADHRPAADGLAALGYLAVCPDLFWRVEPNLEQIDHARNEWEMVEALYRDFDVDAGVVDVAAAIDHVRADPACNGKVGLVGYSFGGLLAFLAAGETDADATVAYYGVGIEAHASEADAIVRPLLMHMAEVDQFVSEPVQSRILAAFGNHPFIEIQTYPGREHGFAHVGDRHYHPADARLADGRSLGFFVKHLG